MSLKIEDYVSEENGNFKVNWESLAVLKNESGYEDNKLFDSFFNEILEYLKFHKLMEHVPKKGTYSMGRKCQIESISPNSLIHYYPTRKQDMVEYAKYFFPEERISIIIN